MNDDRGDIKQDARDLVRVFLETFSSQETIKNGLRFWSDGGLDGLWSYRSRIMSASSTELRRAQILVYESAIVLLAQWETHTLPDPSALRYLASPPTQLHIRLEPSEQ